MPPEETQATPEAPPAPNAELEQARRERDQARREAAVARALRTYPAVQEEILSKFVGSPDDIDSFAKSIQDAYGSLTRPTATQEPGAPPSPAPAPTNNQPAPALAPNLVPGMPGYNSRIMRPAPAPGPGSTVSADTANTMRVGELRTKVLVKEATPQEAAELRDRAIVDSFAKHAAKRH